MTNTIFTAAPVAKSSAFAVAAYAYVHTVAVCWDALNPGYTSDLSRTADWTFHFHVIYPNGRREHITRIELAAKTLDADGLRGAIFKALDMARDRWSGSSEAGVYYATRDQAERGSFPEDGLVLESQPVQALLGAQGPDLPNNVATPDATVGGDASSVVRDCAGPVDNPLGEQGRSARKLGGLSWSRGSGDAEALVAGSHQDRDPFADGVDWDADDGAEYAVPGDREIGPFTQERDAAF